MTTFQKNFLKKKTILNFVIFSKKIKHKIFPISLIMWDRTITIVFHILLPLSVTQNIEEYKQHVEMDLARVRRRNAFSDFWVLNLVGLPQTKPMQQFPPNFQDMLIIKGSRAD